MKKFTAPSKVLEQILSADPCRKGIFIQSQSGTGKTYALVFAAIQGIYRENRKLQAVIFCATFDAAVQTRRIIIDLIYGAEIDIDVGFASKGYAVVNEPFQILIGTPNDVLQQIEHVDIGSLVGMASMVHGHVNCSKIISRQAKMLWEVLKSSAYPVALHSGDLSLIERENVILNFAKRHTQVLITTDVLSRSIDIENLDFVVNFNLPLNENQTEIDFCKYMQRIGRCGRFNKAAAAFTLISDEFLYKVTAKLYQYAVDPTFI